MFMHYIIHIKFTCSHFNIYYLQQGHTLNVSQSYQEEGEALGGLLPLGLDIFGALEILLLLVGLLLCLLAGLLFPPVLLLLPSSIDIASQCGIVLLYLLKFFLDRCQFVF
jgi:hypothetical protein